MVTSLILINGAPGSGKSTIARLLVDERPLALLLDIDTLRGHLGQWQNDPQLAGRTARHLALAMIRTHLSSGFDVLIPQFLYRLSFVLELEQTARETGARFQEITLVSSAEEAAARFAARAGSTVPNHRDANLLQQRSTAQPIEALYTAMIEMTKTRPGTRFVTSVLDDIEGTLDTVRAAIE